jgi:thiamine biosynthesis lipoprotein
LRANRAVDLRPAGNTWLGRFRAMGSPCELVCETPRRSLALALSERVAAEAWRIEDKFSRYLDDNIVARINTADGQPVAVDAETAQLLDFAQTLFELSEGGFDITSGVLREAWLFDGSDHLPSQQRIDQALQRIGWQRVSWRRPNLQMPATMEIDLGGIGKEYAVDRCADLIRKDGAVPCLVNFGGDLAATRAPTQRRNWKVAIEGDTPNEPERLLDLREGALATSGDARRFLLKDGIRYGHILDPVTGWPVTDAPHSVTVAARSCTEAGMISTLAMLKGRDAEQFLEAQHLTYWCRR